MVSLTEVEMAKEEWIWRETIKSWVPGFTSELPI